LSDNDKDDDNDMIYYGLPKLMEIMDNYFENKFNRLQENNKIITLSNKDVIKYDGQIIEVHTKSTINNQDCIIYIYIYILITAIENPLLLIYIIIKKKHYV